MVKPEPTKREIESQKKKETIFQAAMELFKEYGYDNVTMKMIAKASGMSEGSIYHFFGEKAGILPMLTQSIQKNIKYLIEPTDEHLNDPLRTMLEYLTAQSQEYEKLGRELTGVYCSTPLKLHGQRYGNGSSILSTVAGIEPDLLGFIQTAIDRGSMTISIPAEELAFSLICTGSGLVSTWVYHGEGYSLVEASRIIFASVLHAYLSK